MPSTSFGHATPSRGVLALVALFSTILVACAPTGGTTTSPTPTGASAPLSTVHELSLPSKDYTPRAITAGPDGALWFTEMKVSAPPAVAGKIGRVTTAGAFTEYALARSENYAMDITAGPDGNLWFTQANSAMFTQNATSATSAIGRITPRGAITEYALAPSVLPLSITSGPDGALWFTTIEGAAQVGKIGRITTSGAITYFRPPDHSYRPQDITTGPDGALWFTQSSISGAGARIGRVTTSGAFTDYPLPSTVHRDVGAITTGPDGALWFIETGAPKGTADKIARMTTAGAVTEFALGSTDSSSSSDTFAGALTTGPDKALWFGFGASLGRITTSGQTSHIALPIKDNAVGDITVSRDGKLWFTESYCCGPSGPAGVNGKIGWLS